MNEAAPQQLSLQRVEPGVVLIPEGGRINTMFVLRSGEVDVSRQGVRVATVAQPGAIFGEVSVLLDVPHSATVSTRSICELFVISNAIAMLEQRPHLLLQLARLLARRLIHTTASLVTLQQGLVGADDSLILSDEAIALLGDPQL